MTDRLAIGEQGIDAWLAALASDAATPGGGAFAALSAAAGAALISMVGRLTVGKEKFAAVADRMAEIVDECDRERGDRRGVKGRGARQSVGGGVRVPGGRRLLGQTQEVDRPPRHHERYLGGALESLLEGA